MYYYYYIIIILEKLDDILTSAVCDLYGLYKSTTLLVIYLPYEHGSIGVKHILDVYRSTRLAFLIKMLNHDFTQFNEVARYSLKLDMEKRGVPTTQQRENFFGYKLENDGHLDPKMLFGCQSDWPNMLRYARRLGVIVTYFNEKTIVRIGDKSFDDSYSFQKALFRLTVHHDLEKAKQLSIQGSYLCLSVIELKSSNLVLYNWSIQDSLNLLSKHV